MPVEFEVPAEGQVDVTDFYVKAPFAEDVYVKALEIRPGAAQAVHHAGVYVIDRIPEGARLVNGRILSAEGKPMSRRDNSLKNRYNPAPQKTVYWSDQSWDAMYAPQVRITLDERDLRRNAPANGPRQQQRYVSDSSSPGHCAKSRLANRSSFRAGRPTVAPSALWWATSA